MHRGGYTIGLAMSKTIPRHSLESKLPLGLDTDCNIISFTTRRKGAYSFRAVVIFFSGFLEILLEDPTSRSPVMRRGNAVVRMREEPSRGLAGMSNTPHITSWSLPIGSSEEIVII